MLTNLIVAVDLKWGISKLGSIPWKIKEDTNFFQDVTKRSYQLGKKNAMIMGRSTWKSLPDNGRGLFDRINIVVSGSMDDIELNTDNLTKSEAYLVKSLPEAMSLCTKLNPGKIFICGGSQIYKEALRTLNIDEIYLTKINADYDCDNIFPMNELILILPHYREHMNKSFAIKNTDINFIKYGKENLPNTNNEEQQYLDLLHSILVTGHFRQTRNSKTWSTFGKTLEFDLSKGFPILTTKRVFFRGIFEELLFFLRGDTDAKHLSDVGVKIWEANTTRKFLDSVGLVHYPAGTMGPMYGFQMKYFGAEYQGSAYDYTGQGVDQIAYCLNLLKTDPYSRRIMMTTYNPAQVGQGVLYPCHGISIIFNVDATHHLSCMMTQRSVDTACGLPFNISSYALLVHLFCEIINNDVNYLGPKFSPGRLTMILGDTHIYEDHYSDIIRQLLREPYQFPQLGFKRKVMDLVDFKFEDLELIGYQTYPILNFKMIA